MGASRTPQNIQSYATLATIVFQTNQNEEHGGQAIPAFDFFMAPGVRKTFIRQLADRLLYAHSLLSGRSFSDEERKGFRRSTPLASSPLSLIPMLRPKPSL